MRCPRVRDPGRAFEGNRQSRIKRAHLFAAVRMNSAADSHPCEANQYRFARIDAETCV